MWTQKQVEEGMAVLLAEHPSSHRLMMAAWGHDPMTPALLAHLRNCVRCYTWFNALKSARADGARGIVS